MENELEISSVKNWVPLTPEEEERVAELSEVGFSADRIAVVLEKNKRLFLRDFRTQGTQVYNAYQLGVLQAEEDVSRKLLENAKNGNLTAIQQMEKKRDEQRIEDLKQKLFNSGE